VNGVVSVTRCGFGQHDHHVGRMVMTLKPRGERKDDVSGVICASRSGRRRSRAEDLFPAGEGTGRSQPKSSRLANKYTLDGTRIRSGEVWPTNW